VKKKDRRKDKARWPFGHKCRNRPSCALAKFSEFKIRQKKELLFGLRTMDRWMNKFMEHRRSRLAGEGVS
jgi:hypothetical protein